MVDTRTDSLWIKANAMEKNPDSYRGLIEMFRKIRINAGITQTQVAARLGVSHKGTVSNWENLQRVVPLQTLIAWADIIGVELSISIRLQTRIPLAKTVGLLAAKLSRKDATTVLMLMELLPSVPPALSISEEERVDIEDYLAMIHRRLRVHHHKHDHFSKS